MKTKEKQVLYLYRQKLQLEGDQPRAADTTTVFFGVGGGREGWKENILSRTHGQCKQDTGLHLTTLRL